MGILAELKKWLYESEEPDEPVQGDDKNKDSQLDFQKEENFENLEIGTVELGDVSGEKEFTFPIKLPEMKGKILEDQGYMDKEVIMGIRSETRTSLETVIAAVLS